MLCYGGADKSVAQPAVRSLQMRVAPEGPRARTTRPSSPGLLSLRGCEMIRVCCFKLLNCWFTCFMAANNNKFHVKFKVNTSSNRNKPLRSPGHLGVTPLVLQMIVEEVGSG